MEAPMKMVSEDMSLFLNEVPGCYFFVGSNNAEKGYVYSHHHARFDIDEEAMATGVGALAGSALRFLQFERPNKQRSHSFMVAAPQPCFAKPMRSCPV